MTWVANDACMVVDAAPMRLGALPEVTGQSGYMCCARGGECACDLDCDCECKGCDCRESVTPA